MTATPAPAGDDARPLIERAGEDRVLTVPNVFSVVRLCCIPLYLYLLFGRDNRAAAASLLAALGATDWVDGYVARHFHQVTTLGKILDPTADRLLFVVGVGAMLVDGSVPVWVAVLTLVREVLVGAAVVSLALLGARRIDVTWFGKAGTALLLVAYPLFLAGESTLSWRDTAHVLAWVAAVPGLALSYWSAALYVPLARRALSEGRAEAAPGA
jgi:cardiolipin synthase (CMP-forming)